ncbi:MAG: L-threonylcarbamoyladenylate synthase [Candidatus Margulisbacteria bacterium]|nr:L-threonylcarbamoyladenylate synthase [Candidatus Margulisiibacteriota bacterium]
MTIKVAAKILRSGGVIAFPTETVYGIGALLSKPSAIRRIFKIKKRPRSKPLQVLIANMKQALELGKLNAKALKLAKKNWPGPLTLVVYKAGKVPKLVTGGTNKVGLRLPAHRTILALIRKVGPLAATSANKAGEPSALTAKEVKHRLPGLDYILAGRVKLGKASAVIDATDNFKTLRP